MDLYCWLPIAANNMKNVDDALDNSNNATRRKSFWAGQYWKEIEKIGHCGSENFFYLIRREKIKLQLHFYPTNLGGKRYYLCDFRKFYADLGLFRGVIVKYKNKT